MEVERIMKAVILDDEILQLTLLKNRLENDLSGIDVVGSFDNPYKLLDSIDILNPEIAFLDIHLPGIKGIEVASIIQEKMPHIEIVFITGYDQYAIQAFDLFAFDYILKPIQLKRLERTVNKLLEKKSIHPTLITAKPISTLTINCFPSLQLFNEKGQEIPIKWRTFKALELFAYFVHHKGTVIERKTLVDLFWPELDEDRGSQQLYTTIYHIRKILKTENINSIRLKHSKGYFGGYVLEAGDSVIFEAEKWEAELRSLLLIDKQNELRYESLLAQYKGDYFASYDFIWAEAEQERLRKLWLYHVHTICDYYVNGNQYEKAAEWLTCIQEKQPYEEEAYFKLMKLYSQMNHRFLVEEQYHKLTEKMNELGVEPAPDSISWFTQWNKQRNPDDQKTKMPTKG